MTQEARAAAGVSLITLATALNVFHRSGAPFATYTRDNGGPCQELSLFPPELKRTLPTRKWNTPSRVVRSAVGLNMRVEFAGAFSPSAQVPGYGDNSNLQTASTAVAQRQRGGVYCAAWDLQKHNILKLIVKFRVSKS